MVLFLFVFILLHANHRCTVRDKNTAGVIMYHYVSYGWCKVLVNMIYQVGGVIKYLLMCYLL